MVACRQKISLSIVAMSSPSTVLLFPAGHTVHEGGRIGQADRAVEFPLSVGHSTPVFIDE